MLQSLFESLDTGEFEDNGFVRLVRVTHEPGTIHLQLETGIDGEPACTTTWVVCCSRVFDFRFLASGADPLDLVTDSTHPAIRQHTDPHGDIVFTGPRLLASTASTVLGQLWTAHHNAVEEWIPFERYLNPLVSLDQLLAGGYGKLATGPLFLLNAYAAVLRANDFAVGPFLERPAKAWDGRAWRSAQAPLALLRLGSSFVVAETFTATAA